MCQECANKDCPGPEKLREFEDWRDLSDHASEETLVKWVNHYCQLIRARDESGKRYRLRQQMLAKVAEKYLDKDELDRIEQLAQEKMS